MICFVFFSFCFFLTPYNWIRGYLRRADENQDGNMTYAEFKQLLQMINVDLSEHYSRALFKVRGMRVPRTINVLFNVAIIMLCVYSNLTTFADFVLI